MTNPRARFVLILIIFLLALTVFLAIGKGALPIAPSECLAILTNQIGVNLPVDFTIEQSATLLQIRLPRVVLCLMVGAALGSSGAVMQGLFRNPLADPSLIGISSGAAFAATFVVIVGDMIRFPLPPFLSLFAFPIAAFVGALVTTLIVYRLATFNGNTVVTTLLLAGIAINALAQAFSGFLTFYATDTQIRSLTFWKLGSLGGATWQTIAVVAPFMILPILYFPRLANSLNALLLGESEANHLGYDVEKIKTLVVILVALTVGASVAVTGLITFVGLVVPHLLRLLVGADYRNLLPCSALLGAALLLGADLLSRTLVSPAEMPIGIVTALTGAPFFLWLLLREKKRIES